MNNIKIKLPYIVYDYSYTKYKYIKMTPFEFCLVNLISTGKNDSEINLKPLFEAISIRYGTDVKNYNDL
ncbi:UNVERIFIED_CONTAM: hypothetical protein O8I53_08310 [Campylobacter lari]